MSWQGSWAADMSNDENHYLIWQANVGSDNYLYGRKPEDSTVAAAGCGFPWDDIPQRSMA